MSHQGDCLVVAVFDQLLDAWQKADDFRISEYSSDWDTDQAEQEQAKASYRKDFMTALEAHDRQVIRETLEVFINHPDVLEGILSEGGTNE